MNLNVRQKAFFLILLIQQPKKAETFLAHVPAGDRTEMLALYKSLCQHAEKDVAQVAQDELRKLVRSKSQSYFSDVHVDWLVVLLEEEAPEVIAAVLRYLPAERVNAILDGLSQEVLQRLPRLSDTYAVPLALVELFQSQIENRFVLKKTFEKGQKFEFEHFCLLRADQISQTFMALGYQEIALGLISLPVRARDVVLERLSPADRRYVETYLQKTGNVSEKRLKRAQFHLISKEVQAGHSDRFVKTLGFLVFAKMLLMKDRQDLEIIKRKMSRQDANLMQDFVNEQMEKNSEVSVIAFREDMLSAVSSVI
ncbi:MAG: hypothetical protein ACD_62C00208G0005 [uncultured bacterium]|nr:MAG: hypothetical protein ACD_62C00208G0005 [uncultured bacterium]